MISRACLTAWIISSGFVAFGPAALGQFPEESSPTDSSPPSISVEGEQIASWPSDPWMTATRERQIFDALRQEWQLPMFEEPLHQVVRTMAHAAEDIPFRIDERALEEIGQTADVPVTFDPQGLSLGAALNAILHELDLTFQISGGAVIITTHEAAEASLVIRVYDVTPLVASNGDEMEHRNPDWYRIGELIQMTVAPDTWEMLGGPSSLAARVVGDRTVLVIPTTTEVHFQIDALLNRLKKVGFPSRRLGSRYPRASLRRSGGGTSEARRVPASNPRLPRFSK